MKTDSRCTSCGTPIPPGTGRYITPDGIYRTRCGLPFPLGPNVRVQITSAGIEGKQDQKQEVTHGN